MLKCQAKEFTFLFLLTACEQGRESFLFLLLTAHVSYWFIQGPMKEEDVFPGTVYPLLGNLLFFWPDRYKKKLCCTGQSVSTNTPSEPRPFKPTGDDRLRLTAVISASTEDNAGITLTFTSRALFYPKRLTISTFVRRKRNNISLSVQ